jgi:hypothetical protein
MSITFKGKVEYVHRIIAKCFIPNIDNKKCVNHKDGNKHNNSVDNLEWVTYSENHLHAYAVLNKKTPAGKYLGGGVCFDKSRNKWIAYTDFYGKRKYLGRYVLEKEAWEKVDEARWYLNREIKNRGGE